MVAFGSCCYHHSFPVPSTTSLPRVNRLFTLSSNQFTVLNEGWQSQTFSSNRDDLSSQDYWLEGIGVTVRRMCFKSMCITSPDNRHRWQVYIGSTKLPQTLLLNVKLYYQVMESIPQMVNTMLTSYILIMTQMSNWAPLFPHKKCVIFIQEDCSKEHISQCRFGPIVDFNRRYNIL